MIKDSLMVIGKIIRWMGLEFLYGQMVESTQEIIKKTRKKDLEFLNGRIRENTKDHGAMANSMQKENPSIPKKEYGKKEFGCKMYRA